MKDLYLNLTALEPLVITSGSAESMAHECLGYVPGNMLLGSMAASWKKLHPGIVPDDDAGFKSLFLNGGVSWGHAMPLCGGRQSVPVPLCFMRVKNHSALPLEGAESARDCLVFNALAMEPGQSVQSLWEGKYKDSKEIVKTKKMPPVFIDPENLHQAREKREWNIHVAHGDQRYGLQSQLYGYSSLAKGSRLRSRIICHNEDAAEELRKLAEKIKHLYVGHARSAGYGRVRIEAEWSESDAAQISGREFNLFFISQYLPFPSWDDPLKNMLGRIGALVGDEPEIVKSFSDFTEIQGYNGFWNKPRASRTGLAVGSVCRIKFAREVSLPRSFAIGAGQTEGYGRIMCNPLFLEKPVPQIGQSALATGSGAVQHPKLEENRLVEILRARGAKRLIEYFVEQWLHDKGWRDFLNDVSRLARPTASQRNNLRDMSLARFKAMLDKTPGEQWKSPAAYSPFSKRREHLADIVEKLLDPGEFAKTHSLDTEDFSLPGGRPDARELEKYGKDAQRLFIRQLVATWGKMSRLKAREE